MKRSIWLCLSIFAFGTGCATLEDFNYRNVNRGRASVAWKEAKACLPKECATVDYANGFKAGYFAVATGGTSCPPIVPPPPYYAARYQSTEGQSKVNQWYQGYQAGTIAADKDGRSLWAPVPTQDGPGSACPCVELTTDTYQSNVIANPTMISGQ